MKMNNEAIDRLSLPALRSQDSRLRMGFVNESKESQVYPALSTDMPDQSNLLILKKIDKNLHYYV